MEDLCQHYLEPEAGRGVVKEKTIAKMGKTSHQVIHYYRDEADIKI